ncbi:class I SAM-dependent methyltransferase [Halorientalis regularis]|jgi:SAM-dependent methyltransferase|uniref:Methyltransferase domain-containing protein n=1 Tax=Halorientalis regularis TaxID=660518 RepID=A0A1G7FEB3_9EURY|nr:methyltransferase domain-containing protein [Halorientalis regularis]SDE74261.1 Methyltransferase domain-containing protein [Halorientalis regularis]
MPSVLSEADRQRLLDNDDERFYDQPRFVQHVDEPFRERLTTLYRDRFSPDDDVLDLMSSWVSHLPPDLELGEVIGHGLNEAELTRNDRLDSWFRQNLNDDQRLPLESASVDAVLCAVSVQYLQYPGRVFAEVARTLRPGGFVVVSFSNRMFAQKAIRAWRSRSMDERAALVGTYLDSTGAFDDPTVHAAVEHGRDPFYAVTATKR